MSSYPDSVSQLQTTESEVLALRSRVTHLEKQLQNQAQQRLRLEWARPAAETVLTLSQPEVAELNLLRQLVAISPNPVCVKDERGAVVLANEAYNWLRHLSASQPTADAGGPAADLALLASGTPSSQEAAYHLADGQRVWYRTSKQPFTRPDGSRYLLVSATDTTALNHAREVAEESARAKQVFLATMSHEIRTPLNGIIGLARLLQKTSCTTEQTDYLDHVLTSAEGLLVIINDILDFAKIESGTIDLETRPFEVGAAVQQAVKTLVFNAQAKGLQLRVALPPDPLPVVAGDANRLGQVLVNLVNNAIKFTPAGEITVSVTVSEYTDGHLHLLFCVADTGIGIEADKFGQIFQSFAQASSSTTRLYGGTGLGLPICKKLLELQGGRIWLDSQPGRGSRFFFALAFPVSEELPAAPDGAEPVVPGLLQGLRVLLVEDNPVNTLLATSLLHAWQVQADVAADGEQALAHALHTPYDLVLMDIQMPRLNGLEATAQLRSTPGPNQAAPIIALTANALKEEVASYAGAGFSDWLVKPYHENSLYLAIARNTGRAPQPLAEAPAAAPTAPTYDFAGLGKLANDPTFIRKMEQLFIDTVPAQLGQLERAVAGQEWEVAVQLSHNLKSTYGNLQIREALRCTKKIEEILKKNPTHKALENLLRTLRLVTNQMVEVFKASLQQKA